MMRRTITTLLAAVLLSSGLAVAAPAMASAAVDGYDLYDIRADDYRINTGNCRYITVTARAGAVAGPVREVAAEVDLWLGGRSVSSVSLESSGTDTTHLSGRYYFCPGLDEPGTGDVPLSGGVSRHRAGQLVQIMPR
jgi:hypothetical protein